MKYKSLKHFIDEGSRVTAGFRRPRNETYVYHTGNLVVDRLSNVELDKRARYALEQYQAGSIELVQSKNDDETTSYIAIRNYFVSKRPFVGCYREQRE